MTRIINGGIIAGGKIGIAREAAPLLLEGVFHLRRGLHCLVGLKQELKPILR